MQDLVFRLLALKLRDLMLSYGSFRVALEEVLENELPAFEHLKQTMIDMFYVPDDKILEVISDAESEDEAHENIEEFMDDMIAPFELILHRYLDPDTADDLVNEVFETVSPDLHEKVCLHYNQEPVTTEEVPVVTN